MASLASVNNVLNSIKIEEGEIFTVYKLPTTTSVGENFKIRVNEFGTPSSPPKPCKVLLLVGASGDGKTTWINRLANHLVEAGYDDKERYKLIEEEGKSQALSQTKEVAVYKFHIPTLKYTLVVIDTPGFGDTGGVEDCKILSKIREALSLTGAHSSMDEIHGVGLVIRASSSRLNATQAHVFHSIFKMLGKDIENNIFVLTTFDDGDEDDPPLALSAIEEDGIPYAAVFQFNNKEIYKQKKSPIYKFYWDRSRKSFEKFLNVLGQHCGVSLAQTKEVMDQRIVLEEKMKSLHCQMEEIVVKVHEIEGYEEMRPFLSAQVEEETYIILQTEVTNTPAPEGVKVTSCRKCQYTCHSKCWCNTRKYWCRCINILGNCKICPGKCSHKYHVNNGLIYERHTEEKIRETTCYLDTVKNQADVEKQIADLCKQREELHANLKQTIMEARGCLKQLDEIAFKPNSLSETDYIDLLIETEKSKRQPGWNIRISNYEQLKKEMEAIATCTDIEGIRIEENPAPQQNIEDRPFEDNKECQCNSTKYCS